MLGYRSSVCFVTNVTQLDYPLSQISTAILYADTIGARRPWSGCVHRTWRHRVTVSGITVTEYKTLNSAILYKTEDERLEIVYSVVLL